MELSERRHTTNTPIPQSTSKTALGAARWFVTGKDAPKITQGNLLEFLVCGQKGFKKLKDDLLAAQKTVDIVCWGFDPGMELERTAPGKWPRGGIDNTYGKLLENLAKNNIKVRLLLWYSDFGTFKSNTMPGYTDEPVFHWMGLIKQAISAVSDPVDVGKNVVKKFDVGKNVVKKFVQSDDPYGNPTRHKFCLEWFQRHLRGSRGFVDNPNLRVVLRQVSGKDVDKMLGTPPVEEDAPDIVERNALGFASWHQKPVLIDYELGKKAVGYVMGLNSITDYWDTKHHAIDDPLRETMTGAELEDEIKHDFNADVGSTTTAQALRNLTLSVRQKENAIRAANFSHLIPYSDYACRIKGPALERVHQNFEEGWNAFAGAWKSTSKAVAPPHATKPTAYQEVQIVRTQPPKLEKTIKRLYFQATSWAYKYIYIENQYFFYPEFARWLKNNRKDFCQKWAAQCKGKSIAQVPTLYLFVVIPLPEMDGMVPRTFDTLAELGNGSDMPEQAKITGWSKVSVDQLEKTNGLNVSVVRLCTSGPAGGKRMAYREIYIHAKLMIIDDVFVTLGSANINQRSMSGDGEINIAATHEHKASELRSEIFAKHTGGNVQWRPDDMARVSKDWNKLANDNYDAMTIGQNALRGHIVKFMDMRKTHVRVA